MSINPTSCRVLILAAGLGQRLGADVPPKALPDFSGCSLLGQHFRILADFGLRDITVVIGYRAEELYAEVAGLPGNLRVRLIENPSFRNGSIVSLWQARDVLRSGATVTLMDTDVLYDHRLFAPLLHSAHENCFLLDRSIEPGEEPVKLCIDRGRIVDFHKRPQIDHEWHGESVGFFRFSPDWRLSLQTGQMAISLKDRSSWSTENQSATCWLHEQAAGLGTRISAACHGLKSTFLLMS
jgi:choline kinase